MPKHLSMKAKVCLVGAAKVGKTSLIRRFVHNEFDDRYLTTVGTNVSKKTFEVALPTEDLVVDLDMMIWDIMGQMEYLDLLADRYFEGAQGILAVADLTQPATLTALYEWVDRVDRVASQVPVLIAVNKADLVPATASAEIEAKKLAGAFGGDHVVTSAKTGANVEQAFTRLAEMLVKRDLAQAKVS
jgi:small GTP-binding protein